ncbi:DNA polymerase beta domain protein [Candidatus Caldarchaeum subterraneum]|uniref:DNA polymerase beta domain protein n=1 Tax=Caldiarchaeum subterraneum TaxID=311458 RepID=E6N6V5_CALS0|nr:DNA polymerase beta domain protein [Candidatus Caldarchaeum subterraneum]BAJ50824.1 DNA polymerase beta domain protein [Candidatus Caldarchaeum subterraneum]
MSYKSELKAAALQRVNEYIDKLVDAGIKPHSVILFGSYAKDSFTEESDIDICVIAENLPEEESARRSLSSHLPHKGVQAISYFPHEFLELLEKLNIMVLEIVEYGLPIIDDSTFAKAKVILERLKSEGVIKPERDGWRVTKP